jgi:hypothetical protein
LGQKIFISFEQENEVLLDQLDKMENEVFLKNVSNSAQLKDLSFQKKSRTQSESAESFIRLGEFF